MWDARGRLGTAYARGNFLPSPSCRYALGWRGDPRERLLPRRPSSYAGTLVQINSNTITDLKAEGEKKIVLAVTMPSFSLRPSRALKSSHDPASCSLAAPARRWRKRGGHGKSWADNLGENDLRFFPSFPPQFRLFDKPLRAPAISLMTSSPRLCSFPLSWLSVEIGRAHV